MRRVLSALLLALAAPAARGAAAPPDYSGYQALLDRYLVRLEPRSRETDTRFDYEQLYVDEHIWRQRRSATLERIHAQLVAVRPSELPPADRTAWALNTYNFLVLERATVLLLIRGSRFVRYRTVEEMRAPDGAFFSAPVAMIEGRSCSLPEFERRFVYGDTTNLAEPRRTAGDPRLMLALCSGHMGDPPLPPRAFRGDSLAAQLDLAARSALAQPRIATFEAASRQLRIADLIAQRAVDFGGQADAIVRFVERLGPAPLRKAIRKHGITKPGLPIAGDRMLNQWPRPRAAAAPDSSAS